MNANLPLQSPGEESVTGKNVLGEIINAKRPLPVTPCFVEPADDAVDTYQESVSTTPSSTEFVFLMEQLQMSPSQDKD